MKMFQRLTLWKWQLVTLRKKWRFWTMPLKWKVPIEHQHRRKVKSMLVVNGNLLKVKLSRGVCFHWRWLLSELEMGAMKRMLHYLMELVETLDESRSPAVKIQRRLQPSCWRWQREQSLVLWVLVSTWSRMIGWSVCRPWVPGTSARSWCCSHKIMSQSVCKKFIKGLFRP